MLPKNCLPPFYLQWKSIAIIFFFLISMPSATASITVNKTVIYFNANKSPRHDIVVYNHGRQKSYVQTEVFEVINPGTPQEQRRKATDLKNLRVLVSPNKMVIPAGGKKNIRFSYLGDYNKERIFRINVTPIVGKVTAKTTSIKLLVAYQILMIVTPNNAKANITHQRQGNTIVFRNTGNTNVLLAKAKLCPKIDTPSKRCKALSVSKRLYSGNQWRTPVPHGQYIEFDILNGSKSSHSLRRFH